MIPTIRLIAEVAAAHYDVSYADVASGRRHKACSRARTVAMYLARHHTHHSLAEIGRRLGGLDHSTVYDAVRRVRDYVTSDPQAREDLTAIEIGLRAAMVKLARDRVPIPADIDLLATARRVLGDPVGATTVSADAIRAMAAAIVQLEHHLIQPMETTDAAE